MRGSIIFMANQGISVSDNDFTLFDIISKNIDKFLNEGVQVTESIGRNVNKGISDAISIVENTSLAKTIARTITDNLNIVEVALKTVHLQIDNLTFTDSIGRAITRAIRVADTVIINELSGNNRIKSISDGLSFIDSVVATRYKVWTQSIIDNLLSGDMASKNLGRIIQETPGMIDNIAKSIYKMVSDGIIPTEIVKENIGGLFLLEQTRTIKPKSVNNIDAEGQMINI